MSNEMLTPRFLIGALLAGICSVACSGKDAAINTEVVQSSRTLGRHLSPTGSCEVSLELSPQGGFVVLVHKSGTNSNGIRIDDVTGIAWLSARELIFSVSPIYGKPGIFRFDCVADTVTKLISATNVDANYPDGADYFELLQVNTRTLEISYRHLSDVDAPDFDARLRSSTPESIALDH